MQLKISAKQLGKKHALIDKMIIEIDDIGEAPTVLQLINAVVRQQVMEYNIKPKERNLLPFLDKNNIDEQAVNGRISFGSIYHYAEADLEAAQQTAIQAMEDGLYVLFAGDEEFTKPHQIVSITEDTVITFIRLTFLAGSYW